MSSSRIWMLQEGSNELRIKMPSDTFLVQIHTSSKIIFLKKISNLKLLRGWLREAYFEMFLRIKKSKSRNFGDSDDIFMIKRVANSIMLETQNQKGISYLNRAELIQARHKISKMIHEIYEIRRNPLSPDLVDLENYEEEYQGYDNLPHRHGVIHTL